MLKKEPYFGYGVFASRQLMKALLGRVPKSMPAFLQDYRLYIQSWKDIPPEAHLVLDRAWNDADKFRRYIIRAKKGSVVHGRLWFITHREREIIDDFEMNDGTWVNKANVMVSIKSGGSIVASTEILEKWTDALKPAKSPKKFLNNRQKMFNVAEWVRFRYMSSH